MKMRTAVALLVEDDFANRLAPFTLRCRDYGFNLRVLRLPAHVSLKQPFVVDDFERFEQYVEEFAGRIEPQPLRSDGFRCWGDEDEGGVAAHVIETPRLRQLHTQLNVELAQIFGETQADYDGDAYWFHLTVAIGPYRADTLSQLRADIVDRKVDEPTVSARLAVFIYEESAQADPLYGVREYGTYKILPLR